MRPRRAAARLVAAEAGDVAACEAGRDIGYTGRHTWASPYGLVSKEAHIPDFDGPRDGVALRLLDELHRIYLPFGAHQLTQRSGAHLI